MLQRNQNKFFPSGASTFSPTGVRTARINLTGATGWVDPSTIKVGLTLTNNSDDVDLILAGSPATLVQRIRVLISGVVVEDVDYYGRVHTMYERLRPHNWNINSAIENNLQKYKSTSLDAYMWGLDSSVIAPGYSAKIIFTPHLGILKSKYLPIKYAPIQLELTFANAEDVVLVRSGNHTDTEVTNFSTSDYTISQLEIFCSQVQLDSALEQSYASMLLQNRALTFAYRTTLVQTSVIPDGSTSAQVSLVRAVSRLDALFVTFTATNSGQGAHTAVGFLNPSDRVPGGSAKEYGHSERNMEAQVQIGSALFPTSPINSQGEFFYRLLETLDLLDQNLRSVAITPKMYDNAGFIWGTNLQTVPGQAFTGRNVRTGDLVTIKVKNLSPQLVGTKMYIFALTTMLAEIRESGTQVFE